MIKNVNLKVIQDSDLTQSICTLQKSRSWLSNRGN